MLSTQSKKKLLQIAALAIHNIVTRHETFLVENKHMDEELKTTLGAFVTLHKHGELRGCIGRISGRDQMLYQTIHQMAIAAASRDTRFKPILETELKELNIEISVLSPLEPIYHAKDIKIGKHGVYVKHGYKTGVLLPQVAIEQNWDSDTLVKYCMEKKAGMNAEEILNAEMFVFEADIFESFYKNIELE